MAPIKGKILVELSAGQRDAMVELVHTRMDHMRSLDPNSWMSEEYTKLENIVFQLTINSAE